MEIQPSDDLEQGRGHIVNGSKSTMSSWLDQVMTSSKNDPLAPEALAHLKSYKYSSVDKSYLTHFVLKHYWNAFVNILPLWIAPNMVTLLGFFFILANVALLVITIPDLIGPGPSWIYFSFAFGLFMYQTLDNVDGKQARRTGTSSPLGELFDHGVDSLNCTLASLLTTAAMGLGSTYTGAFTSLVPCLPMFFSTWETYHTHTLYLGYFNGPTEGLILAVACMVASGVMGPQIWDTQVADIFGNRYLFHDLTLKQSWVPIILFAFFTAHLPECVYNVVQARRRADLPVFPVFLDWTPIFVYVVATIAWLGSPYSRLLKDNHLVLFCVTMSFGFGRMTTKMILHHLTRREFPYWTVMLFPLVGGAVLTNLPRLGYPAVSATIELRYLQAYFAFACAVYMTWALRVINVICEYLDINCLTIKKRDIDQVEVITYSENVAEGNGHLRKTNKQM